MISIVIPTRNRSYTLKKVLPSYYIQKHVSEIIIVDDHSTDHTKEVVDQFSGHYPNIKTKIIQNKNHQGASYSRNQGVNAASNNFILFGEDDAYLEGSYTEILLRKFQTNHTTIGIVSGRLILMYPTEDPKTSIQRFGNGNPKHKKLFHYTTCSHVPDAYFEGDVKLPLTHALILTTKELLLKFPFDIFYSKGNAYREESDFQMHAYTYGYDILVTNETHCMHLHPRDVRKGGHRIGHLKSLYYKIYYTNYFYDKYYNKLKSKDNLLLPKMMAITLYAFIQTCEFGFAVFRYLKKSFFSFFLTRKEK